MKKLFGLLSILIAFSAQAITTDAPGIPYVERQYQTYQNLIANPGFENGTNYWTGSGGTLTYTTSSTLVGSGSASGSWDSNASGQTITTQNVAIPIGAYGKTAVAACDFLCDTGTCTHTISAYDGTTLYGTTTITSSTSVYNRTYAHFTMPSSTSGIRLRITSVASNEPALYIDNCYLGVSTLTSLDFESSNTPSSVVYRDTSGNFSAGTITATLSGNATSATNIAGGSAGQIPFQTGSSATSFDSDFTWDNSNKELNILSNNPAFNISSLTGTNRVVAYNATNTGGSFTLGIESSTGGNLFSGGTAYATILGNGGATPLQFATNNTVRMTISSAGAVNLPLLTASQAVFTDSSKNLVSNAITGSGNVVMSTSPTLAGDVNFSQNITLSPSVNSSLTGANQRIPTTASSNIVFTNASLTSIGSFNTSFVGGGRTVQLTNETGGNVTILNNYSGASAGEAFLMASGTDLVLPTHGSIIVGYDATASAWIVLASSSSSTLLTGDVTSTSGGVTTVAKIQGTTVSGTTGSGNVVFSASPTLSGTVGGTLSFSGTDTFSHSGVGLITTNSAEFGKSITIGDTSGIASLNSVIYTPVASFGISPDVYGLRLVPEFATSSTSSITGVYSGLTTAAGAFTATNLYNFYADTPTKGAGSSITNAYGLYVNTQNQGTNNWAIYTNGTAPSTFGGAVNVTGNINNSTLTVNQAVFTDGSKNLVSNTVTGSSNVVMSNSPTLTGTVGGNLTWSGTQAYNADVTQGANVTYTPTVNSSLTGANARIPSHASSNLIFSNASLTSIASANNGGVSGGHTVQITNETGGNLTIVNNYGSAAAGEAIFTGAGTDIILPVHGSIWMQYNATASVWGVMAPNYAKALTGDVTASAGSTTTTVAKIQGTTVSGTTGTGNVAFSASPTFTGTVTIPSPFTLGATSMTSTGTQLNYLNAATGTTGTTNTNLVFSASPTFTGTVVIPSPFTLGATSMTSTGTQLNYLNAATGTTGTTSTNVVFSTSPSLTTPSISAASITGATTITDAATLINASTSSKVLAFSLSGMTAARTLTLSSSQSTSQTLNIPNITATDTLATLGLAQTFSGSTTFSSSNPAVTATNGNIVTTNSNAFQSFGVGSSGAGNQEYFFFEHDGASGVTLASQATGTGTVRPLNFKMGSTIVSTLDSSGNLTVGTKNNIVGSNGTSDATAGNIGEYIESTVTSDTSFPTSGTTGDCTSITLTAGDWDISNVVYTTSAGGTNSYVATFIGTASGNNATNRQLYSNYAVNFGPSGSVDVTLSTPSWRTRVSTSTTYYSKVTAAYTGTAPKYECRISARRIR